MTRDELVALAGPTELARSQIQRVLDLFPSGGWPTDPDERMGECAMAAMSLRLAAMTIIAEVSSTQPGVPKGEWVARLFASLNNTTTEAAISYARHVVAALVDEPNVKNH